MPEHDWSRPNWQSGGGDPFLAYAIYGITAGNEPLRSDRYRTRGLPEGIEALVHTRELRAAYLRESFEEGQPWDDLVQRDPALAERVLASPGCVLLSGGVSDQSSLLYLRDVVGFISFLLDHGGVAVYDLFTFQWWHPAEWQRTFFEDDEPQVAQHANIYFSQELPHRTRWLYTHGLRKFGRPDISVRHTPAEHLADAAGVCAELIEYQALGGVLAEHQGIRHPVLGRLIVHHAGSMDDPEFNNVHVELQWVR
jgi:hypothetical protein